MDGAAARVVELARGAEAGLMSIIVGERHAPRASRA